MRFFRAFYRLIGIAFITIYDVLGGIIRLRFTDDKDAVRKETVQNWARKCLRILQIKVHQQINSEALPKGLIMSNHRSYLDIFVLLSIYPSSIVAKSEIGKWPMIRHGIDLGDIILVDRHRLNSKLQTMKEIKQRLDQNKNVILFPEGGIGESHLPMRFKNGSFLIAAKLESPVNPIALWYHNLADAWIGDESLLSHFFRQMGKKETMVDMKVMDPVSHKDAKKLNQMTFDKIETAIKEYDEVLLGLPKTPLG